MKRVKIYDHNWLALKIHNDFFRRIRKQLKGTVVDLGCGTQPYQDDILNLGCKYVSVDWSNSYHQGNPDVIADLNIGVDLPDCFADSVIAFSVLEHLHRPGRLVEEAYRILKLNGKLYMQVPFQWAVHESPYDYMRFTKYGLHKILEDSGFNEIEINADCGYWVTAILKFNYHTKRFIRGPKILQWFIRILLTPLWFGGQVFSIVADRFDLDENETASYTIVARKVVAC
jgi:SAM-dependent methyltransferase